MSRPRVPRRRPRQVPMSIREFLRSYPRPGLYPSHGLILGGRKDDARLAQARDQFRPRANEGGTSAVVTAATPRKGRHGADPSCEGTHAAAPLEALPSLDGHAVQGRDELLARSRPGAQGPFGIRRRSGHAERGVPAPGLPIPRLRPLGGLDVRARALTDARWCQATRTSSSPASASGSSSRPRASKAYTDDTRVPFQA